MWNFTVIAGGSKLKHSINNQKIHGLGVVLLTATNSATSEAGGDQQQRTETVLISIR